MAGRPSGRCAWDWTPQGKRLLAGACALAAFGMLALSRPDPVRPPPAPDLAVDPNTAPPAVLTALPRIGPSVAARIVEARERGPLANLEDLDRHVRGIGPATLAALRPHLRFPADDAVPDIDARLASRTRPGSGMP